MNDLQQLFPNCFFKRGKEKPLKLGIHADLLQRQECQDAGMSRTHVRRALYRYTHRPTYLTGLQAHRERIDLDGNHIGHVTVAEYVQAKTLLAQIAPELVKPRRKTPKRSKTVTTE